MVCGGTLKDSRFASLMIDVDRGKDSILLLDNRRPNTRIGHGSAYDWHPNGKSIIVRAFVDGKMMPYGLPIVVPCQEIIFDGLPDDAIAGDFAISSDAQFLVVALTAAAER